MAAADIPADVQKIIGVNSHVQQKRRVQEASARAAVHASAVQLPAISLGFGVCAALPPNTGCQSVPSVHFRLHHGCRAPVHGIPSFASPDLNRALFVQRVSSKVQPSIVYRAVFCTARRRPAITGSFVQ
jgi:hypothetical protein